MKKSNGLSERSSDIVLVAITAIVLIIVAYPLYYVLIASVSDPYDVYAGKTFLFPSGFTLDGYIAVFKDPNIVSGFLNSVKYTVIGTIFSVVMLYITAYPLAQRDLPGRKFLSVFFLITMYFGGGLVPTYLVVKQTGLVGSMWSLLLPGGVAVGVSDRWLLQIGHVPPCRDSPLQADPCGHGSILHGGLLERLVYSPNLFGRGRVSTAAGHAEHPHQEFHLGIPGRNYFRWLRRAEQADRTAEVLLHDRGGGAHAHRLSLCPEIF